MAKALAAALKRALRARRDTLVLTPFAAEAPNRWHLGGCEPVTDTERVALRRAQAGDWTLLHEMELEAINFRVRQGDLALTLPDGRLHPWFDPETEAFERIGDENVPHAWEISRAAGPAGESLVAWMILPYCGRCFGRRLRCRFCDGKGIVEPQDWIWLLSSTLDGVVIEDFTAWEDE